MKLFGKWKLSLRLVLSLIITFVSVVPAIIVSVVLINSAIVNETEIRSSEIQGQILILSNQLQKEDYINKYITSDMTEVVQQMADIWGCRIQITNYSGRIIYDSYNVDKGRYNVSEYVLNALCGTITSQYDSASKQLAVAMPIQSSTETELKDIDLTDEDTAYVPKIDGSILVNVDMQRMITGLSQLSNQSYLLWMAVFCFAMLVVVLVLIYVFKPFRQLVHQMEGAYDGTTDKIDVPTYSETDKLSKSVNKTLEKLQNLDLSRREFVSNVSHELKTPITSVRVLADSLNSMEGAPIEMYQEFMQDISKELERESNTIDDLLSMVRLEEGVTNLNISEVDVNSWLEDTLRRVMPIANAAGIQLSLESLRPVIAYFDESKMSRVFMNLLTNSIKYNKVGGWVKVLLDADYHYFTVTIEDSGIGIPAESIPHIFDKFYRVDKARSREAGGTGLGLSISKNIVNLHNGTIKVTSQQDVGSTFVVKVPLEYRQRSEEADDEETDN